MPNFLPRLSLVGVDSPVAPLELFIDFSQGRPEDAAVSITALLKRFVQVGMRGGYPLTSVAADRSGLELASGPSTSSVRLSYKLKARNIDARAFQILRLMVGAFPAQTWEVGIIQVRESRPGILKRVDVPIPKHETYYDHYPDISSLVSFFVEWVDLPSKSRRYLVELDRPVQPDQLQAVADLVQMWWALVEANGFFLPADLPLEDIESSFGAVTQLDEFTIEITVDLYMAAETAWKVLTNLLDAYNRAAVSIVKVVIE